MRKDGESVTDRSADLPVDPDTAVDAREPAVAEGTSFLRSRWDVLLVISAGGALGSVARWGVGELLPWTGTGFPWATFVENVSGGFVLGVLMVFLLDVWAPHRYLRPFLGVGLLGGYTTFSTYMLESRDLLVAGQPVTAFAYLAGSLLAGLAAVWLGIALARLRTRGARRRNAETPASTTAVPVDDEVRNP